MSPQELSKLNIQITHEETIYFKEMYLKLFQLEKKINLTLEQILLVDRIKSFQNHETCLSSNAFELMKRKIAKLEPQEKQKLILKHLPKEALQYTF